MVQKRKKKLLVDNIINIKAEDSTPKEESTD